MRFSARCTDDVLVASRSARLSAVVSSEMVESGRASTRRLSRFATGPRSGEKLPPPGRFGSVEPVSRCILRIRFTVATPSPVTSAMSAYVRPSSRSRTTTARNGGGVGGLIGHRRSRLRDRINRARC